MPASAPELVTPGTTGGAGGAGFGAGGAAGFAADGGGAVAVFEADAVAAGRAEPAAAEAGARLAGSLLEAGATDDAGADAGDKPAVIASVSQSRAEALKELESIERDWAARTVAAGRFK